MWKALCIIVSKLVVVLVWQGICQNICQNLCFDMPWWGSLEVNWFLKMLRTVVFAPIFFMQFGQNDWPQKMVMKQGAARRHGNPTWQSTSLVDILTRCILLQSHPISFNICACPTSKVWAVDLPSNRQMSNPQNLDRQGILMGIQVETHVLMLKYACFWQHQLERYLNQHPNFQICVHTIFFFSSLGSHVILGDKNDRWFGDRVPSPSKKPAAKVRSEGAEVAPWLCCLRWFWSNGFRDRKHDENSDPQNGGE